MSAFSTNQDQTHFGSRVFPALSTRFSFLPRFASTLFGRTCHWSYIFPRLAQVPLICFEIRWITALYTITATGKKQFLTFGLTEQFENNSIDANVKAFLKISQKLTTLLNLLHYFYCLRYTDITTSQ